MQVVSLMAHQDDEMRCLGTLLKCQARGDRIAFATVADGSRGFVQNPTISREQAAAIRHEEMSALAGAMQAEYCNLREPDEYLFDTAEVRERLIEVLRRFRAELVFTHYEEDYNLDHTTVSRLVRHCAMLAALPVIATASPPLAETPAVFMVEPHGAFSFPASHYVDISPFFARKVELLRHHRSQEEALLSAMGKSLAEICADQDRFRGSQVGCAYAEAFIPMPGRGTIKPYPTLP